MRALVFRNDLLRQVAAGVIGKFDSNAYVSRLALVGSNAFGWVDRQAERRHCYEVYWQLCRDALDLSPLLTDRYPLDQWSGAFLRTRSHPIHPTIKVAFDFRRAP